MRQVSLVLAEGVAGESFMSPRTRPAFLFDFAAQLWVSSVARAGKDLRQSACHSILKTEVTVAVPLVSQSLH